MANLSTIELTAQEAFELWRDVTRRTYDLAVPKGQSRSLRIRAEMHHTPSLTMSEFVCDGNQKSRDSRQVAQDGRPYLKLRRYLSGRAAVIVDDQLYQLRPGATYLIDQSRPFTELSSDNHQRSVFVSHDMIGYDPVGHAPVIAWPDESVDGALILAGLDRLWSRSFRTDNDDPEGAERIFVDLLRGVLLQAADSFDVDAVREARHRAIEAQIERHLRIAPWQTVDEIIAALPFARASLYRHFQQPGGISRHLRRRRMALAFRALSETNKSQGAVSRVAEKVGYASIHSFSKTFKREIGYTPAEIVGTRSASDSIPTRAIPAHVAACPSAGAFIEAFDRIRAL